MATLNYNNVSMEIPIPSNYTNNTGYISQLPYTLNDIENNENNFMRDYSGKLMSAIEINWGNAHSDEQESFPAYINSSLDIVAGMTYLNSRTTHISNIASSHETEIGKIKADINTINNTYIYKIKNDISSLNERVNNAHFEYQYFTIEVEDKATIQITNLLKYIFQFDDNELTTHPQLDELNNFNNIVFEYSYNGEDWEAIDFGNSNVFSYTFHKKILLRCDCSMLDETLFSNNHIRGVLTLNVKKLNGSFEKFKVYGNIMSLIYGENFIGKNDLLYKGFSDLFSNSLITDAENLILPTTVLPWCYSGMFTDCTSLENAPDLPAKQLEHCCYKYMFFGCESLKNTPDLPATSLKPECYSSMFYDCIALKNASNLPAKQLEYGCYSNMFSGCTSLENAPELPAITMKEDCYKYMFFNCENLEKAPDLPGMIMAEGCYSHMFDGCTNLKSIPNSLPSTNLAENCYAYMFKGCTYLNVILDLPSTDLADGCYAHMFEDCTYLKKAPELKADLLHENCYAYMFNGCTSLNYIRMLGFYYFNADEGSNDPLLQAKKNENNDDYHTDTTNLETCMSYFAHNVSDRGVFYKNRMYPKTVVVENAGTENEVSYILDLPKAMSSNSYSGYPDGSYWTTKKDIGISVIGEVFTRSVVDQQAPDYMRYPLDIEDMQSTLFTLSNKADELSTNLSINIERLADTEQRIDRVSQQASELTHEETTPKEGNLSNGGN